RTVERLDTFRQLLQNALTVDSTLAAQKQNDDTKKISGWAAILFAPTLVAAIYGMNFTHMPELQWPLGYPLAIVAMVAVRLPDMPHTGHATRTTPLWALKLAVITALVGVAGGIAGIAVWLALQLIQFVAFGYPFGGHLEAADAPSPLNRFLALVA
ncbi:CorA family divalent cation transporter, partial [Mycobacteroides abscessus]|uniref:CorA family divalent cation transporter n=1 Tax=Mycobacteroides abscessus TaxID=36809 RepID=UPI000B0E2D9F